MNLKKLIALIGLLIAGGLANAAETTGAQAETATRNWIRRHGAPLGTRLSSEIGESRAVRNDAGRTIFHAVNLKGGGFVVTSGDTKVEPIVAFSDSGSFEASDRNPLFVLISEHVGKAVAAADAAKPRPRLLAKGAPVGGTASAESAAETEWSSLLVDSPVMSTKSAADTDSGFISDMRVPPLCPTQWSQQGWNSSGYAFNYYTPENYPCGCTATAMAQVMYRWKYPARTSPQTFICSVDGTGYYIDTMGGTYAWDTMPQSMVTHYSATPVEREAVGHLLYDVGVALKSEYTYGGTGSYGFFIPDALKGYFGYAEAKCYCADKSYGSDVSAYPAIENGVYASLDAGMPVLLSIHKPLSGSKSGHCVVLDGYGYVGSSRWTHLNSGWAGKSDAWYRFFAEPLTDMEYTYLQEYVYNVHPHTTGDVISGRVLDHTGKPVSGATVTCKVGSTTKGTATSDEYGIYSFRVTGSNTYTLSASKSGRTSGNRNVSVTIGTTSSFSSVFDGGWLVYNVKTGSVGNRWGQDLVLAEPKPETLTIIGASAVRSGETSKYEAIVTYTDGSEKTVSTLSDWSLTKTAASSTIGNSDSNKGLLSVGETYDTLLKVTIQAKYLDKTATIDVRIIPLERTRTLEDLTIEGKSSLEGGESADYTAVAHFSDGSVAVVTTNSEWGVGFGETRYASIGAKTGKLDTLPTEEVRKIHVMASYVYGGRGMMAEKEVTITFTARLRRPTSLLIEGNSSVTVGKTSPYTAKVTYNDGSSAVVTMECDWTLSSGSTYGRIAKDVASSRAILGAKGIGSVVIKAEYGESGTKVSSEKPVTIVPEVTIPEAVDVEKDGKKLYDLVFTTGSTVAGGNAWYGQKSVSRNDGDAAQSGFMTGSYGQNWLETTVKEAGTFSFWWNVSSEPTYDHLKFEIDGIEKARISGTDGDWQKLTYEIPAGTHTLRWTYVKDEINDFGQDAGWVDWITWTPTPAPLKPTVTATDGTRTDAVLVSWTLPSESVRADKYELARSRDGGTTWDVLLASTLDTSYLDKAAEAGVDYTYRVRAGGLAGWGEGGTDVGWRKIALSVAPDAFVAAHKEDGRIFSAAVTTEVAWVAARADGSDWLTITTGSGTGNGTLAFTVGERDSMESRTGTVTVTAGEGTGHPETATVTVTQTGRPAKNNIGFFKPTLEWRTRLQVSPFSDGTYNPTSVFTTAEAEAGDYRLSFGWTNRGETAVSLPSVRFRCLDPDRKILLEWTEPGREVERLSPNTGTWSVNWQCDVVRVLDPGDYMIEAELDPGNSLGDVDRSDNTAVFRFAIRDPELDAWAAFEGEAFTNLSLNAGNDFAQAPHPAFRTITNEAARTMVQFGPYVPMDGVSVTGGKGALDIVFLIDVTGSMSGCINGLKANIKSFFASLITGENAVTDWRAKVVGYRDITCDRSWFEDHGFTTDVGALNGQIADCYASGGGDGPESLLDALCKIADESEFREDAARVIVAFTDAPEKQPMSYGRFSKGGVPETQTVLNDNDVALWLVAEWYGYYSGNFKTLCDGIKSADGTRMGTLIEVDSLGLFTSSTDELKELAGNIGTIVPTTIVDPKMAVSVRGRGTLRFKWCNDSTAGEDNLMAFTHEGSPGNVTMYCDAGKGWQNVELDLTETGCDGWHLFDWVYNKTNYNGSVTDCGLVSDIRWEPIGTKLEVEPDAVSFTWDGFDKADGERGSAVKVTCNSIWKSSTDADWVHLVRGTGDGDGELYFEVATNTTYTARSATITVRAGEYGLPTDMIVEKTIVVMQEESPVLPTDEIQILSVDVKPRWPWNELVDIDFRIVPPKGGSAVDVYFSATNVEGRACRDDFAYLNGKNMSYCEPKVPTASYFWGDAVAAGATKAVCATAGIYRVTWKMINLWDQNSTWLWPGGFHSPEVVFVARAEASGKATVALASEPVRIDLRQKNSGGLVLSGMERIGHPEGKADPVWIDTTKLPNGWNALPIFDDLSEHNKTSLVACVVNDAAVEGGTITGDVVWKSDRIHVVRDNVFIAKGASLTIEDGTIVKFCQAARIFMYRDTSKTGVGYSNLRMKGVYCTGGYDNYYGSDILRAGEMTPNQAAHDNGWQGWQYIVYADGTSGYNTRMVAESTSYAVRKIRFFCPPFDEEGIYNGETATDENSYVIRYYTRGETWGVLPKLCKAGQEFYGWFGSTLTQYCTESIGGGKQKLSAEKYHNKGSGYLLDASNVAWNFASENVSGLMVKAGLLGENLWPSDPADVGNTLIKLKPESAVYNGMEQKPTVASVVVSGVTIPAENYDIAWGSGNYTDAGDYEVGVNFKHDFSGTPTAKYTIKPCPVDSAVVKFYYDAADPEMGYSTAKEEVTGVWYKRSGVPKPKVHVYVGGMGTPAPESDYVVSWHDEDWPAIGTYTADVEFTGNYIGTARGEFTIERNPTYAVEWYDSVSEVAKMVRKLPLDGGKPRRVLYLGGRESDIPSRLVRNYIEKDADIYNFVIDNFVCWNDDCDAPGSSFGTYSRGMGSVTLPLLAVISTNDWSKCVGRTCWPLTREGLKDFLMEMASAPEDASSAVLTLTGGNVFTYDGAPHCPSVTVTYGGVVMPSANYDVVCSPADCVGVGDYTLKVHFKGTYNGYAITGETASVSFRIEAKPIEDGDVTLTPAGAEYTGAAQRPTVTVKDVSETEYVVSYGVGDYVGAGPYTVTVEFFGTRSGKVTRNFTITPRPVTSANVELSAYSAVYDGTYKRPDVLSVSDSKDRFVAGTDYDVDFGAGDYTKAGVYTITVTFRGNYSKTATAAFEIVDASKKEKDLPLLDDGATAKDIGEALAPFTADPNVLEKITTLELYRQFREWVLKVGFEAAKKSVRAYESFRVSSILSMAQLFDSEVLTLTMTEQPEGLVSDGKFCVKVSLRDVSVKGEEVQFQLAAAKDAFAEIVRRSDDLKNLKTGKITASDVTASMDSGEGGDKKSVLLSVKCPDGAAGFLKLVIE